MSLDPLQERIVRIALALPEAKTLALAGGGAMIAHGFVVRETRDVDLFTEVDDAEALAVAAALRTALTAAGLRVRDAAWPPFDHRCVAVDVGGGRECTVEVGGYMVGWPSGSGRSCIRSTWGGQGARAVGTGAAAGLRRRCRAAASVQR